MLLLKTREDDYRAAQAARSLARLETARNDSEKALDRIQISRAEKLVRTYQWELERVARRLYGQSRQESPDLIQINIGIARKNEAQVDPVECQQTGQKPKSYLRLPQ